MAAIGLGRLGGTIRLALGMIDLLAIDPHRWLHAIEQRRAEVEAIRMAAWLQCSSVDDECCALLHADVDVIANSLQMLVALAFSALGGFLVPLQNLPDAARTVASYTPNGVAIRTMRDVATAQTGPAGVTGPVLLILTFAAVVATIGFVNGRRVMET